MNGLDNGYQGFAIALLKHTWAIYLYCFYFKPHRLAAGGQWIVPGCIRTGLRLLGGILPPHQMAGGNSDAAGSHLRGGCDSLHHELVSNPIKVTCVISRTKESQQ